MKDLQDEPRGFLRYLMTSRHPQWRNSCPEQDQGAETDTVEIRHLDTPEPPIADEEAHGRQTRNRPACRYALAIVRDEGFVADGRSGDHGSTLRDSRRNVPGQPTQRPAGQGTGRAGACPGASATFLSAGNARPSPTAGDVLTVEIREHSDSGYHGELMLHDPVESAALACYRGGESSRQVNTEE